MVPVLSKKATERGMRVFFIHMHTVAGPSKTKIIPSLGAIFSRNIKPCSRSASVAATSALMRYMPMLNCVVGNFCIVCAEALSELARSNAANSGRIAFMLAEKWAKT